jgi:hypothetical protein
MMRIAWSACALALTGCATGAPAGAMEGWGFRTFGPAGFPRGVPQDIPARNPVLGEGARDAVVAAARALVGKSGGDDCTALVRAIFRKVDVDVLADAAPDDNGVTAIYRFAQGRGRVFTSSHPMPGDLVFFRDTYDRNHDGQDNDGLTHVGLVDGIEPDGTVEVIHRVQRGVVRYRMNLEHPDQRVGSGGETINDYLRPAGRGRAAVLAGQLFAAYATLYTQVPSPSRLSDE